MGTTSHKRQSKRILAVTLALLAASQLAGCGGSDNKSGTSAPPPVNNGGGGNGGGNGGDGGGNNPPVGQLSGVFVDAPVAGLNYTTSSDLSGITDASGRYNYNPGDTVTFSIGDLVLGTVPGQGVVTPMTVATALTADTSADAATVAVNLLVLLQSLDADGNPDNGITFTSAIRDAIAANAIDLTAAEGAFTSALSSFVSSVSGTSGVSLTPVDRADAIAHFRGQAPGAVAGVYVRTDENFEPITEKIVTLTMFRSGRYLLGGQHDSADCTPEDAGGTPLLEFSDARGNGVEYGSYTWDPLTNEFSVSAVNVETDGLCGFHQPVDDGTDNATELEITTDGLVFRDGEGNVAYRFARFESDNSTIAGSWLQPTSLMQGHPFQFTLFASSEDGKTGRYLMVDASAPDTEFDTSPGIEEGCYSIDANDNLTVELNSSVCSGAIDTNDTAGMSNAAASVQLFVDENDRMVVVEGEDVTGFARFPSAPLTISALEGAWVLEHEPGAELGTGPKLAMLTVFEDGRFLFGTHEDDASCVTSYPTPGQEAGGNGLEYGTLSLTSGLVLPNVEKETNGECGLFDANKEFEQRYFVAPNAAGDAFALWSNDDEDAAGIVFKRVPSVPNEITGAWLWADEEAGEDQFAVVAYLPAGVMFEVSLFEGEDGIRRESFTMNGNTMTSQIAGYEYCVDTESAVSECLGDPEPLVETYIVNGDVITDDDEEGSMTRIPSP